MNTSKKTKKANKHLIMVSVGLCIIILSFISKSCIADDLSAPVTDQTGRVGFCAYFNPDNVHKLLYICKMNGDALDRLMRFCSQDPDIMMNIKSPKWQAKYINAISEFSRVQSCMMNFNSNQ